MNRHSSVVTTDQLIEQFHEVVTDTEQLLKSVATAGGEKAGALRASAEQSLAKARDRLRDFQVAATNEAEAAAGKVDAYVHKSPWQAIGVAAGLAVIASVVIGLLLNRR